MPLSLNHKLYDGPGPDLLILHGLFGMLDNWHTLATRFSEHYRVWTADLRNHGRSPHADDFDYPAMAEDVAHFIDEHGLRDVTLLGHSMGGKTAMELALGQPGLLKRLIVVDIATKGYDRHHDEIIDALESIDLTHVQRRAEVEELLGEKITEAGVRLFLMKNIDRTAEGYRWKMNLPVIIQNYPLIVAGLQEGRIYDGPTLFVKGGRSRYISDADHDALLMQFPKAEIATIEKAGHWVHADAPEEFYNTVLGFLTAN